MDLSQTTLRNVLYELGYRCRRPRLSASKVDEFASQKLKAIREAFQNQRGDSVILYQDKSTFRLLPPLRRMWMKLSVFVALNAKSGNHMLFLIEQIQKTSLSFWNNF